MPLDISVARVCAKADTSERLERSSFRIEVLGLGKGVMVSLRRLVLGSEVEGLRTVRTRV